ncbi:MAG TPA: TPM domain-containing protein, partial [bacterium]
MRGRSVLALLLIAAGLWGWVSPAPAAAGALAFPGPTGYVNDVAHLLDPSSYAALEQRLAEYDRATGNQIAIAIFPDLGGVPIDDFAARLEEAWKVGRRGKDNGLLLVIGVNERQVRIEVGYGLEGKVTDSDAGNIIRNVIRPAFQAGRYADGLDGAITQITGLIGGAPTGAAGAGGPPSRPPSPGIGLLPLILFLAFVGLTLAVSRTQTRRCPRCRAVLRPGGRSDSVVGARAVRVWVCPRCGYQEKEFVSAGPGWSGPLWVGGGSGWG